MACKDKINLTQENYLNHLHVLPVIVLVGLLSDAFVIMTGLNLREKITGTCQVE